MLLCGFLVEYTWGAGLYRTLINWLRLNCDLIKDLGRDESKGAFLLGSRRGGHGVRDRRRGVSVLVRV